MLGAGVRSSLAHDLSDHVLPSARKNDGHVGFAHVTVSVTSNYAHVTLVVTCPGLEKVNA